MALLLFILYVNERNVQTSGSLWEFVENNPHLRKKKIFAPT